MKKPTQGGIACHTCVVSFTEETKAEAKLTGLNSFKEPSVTGLEEGPSAHYSRNQPDKTPGSQVTPWVSI